MGNPIQSLSAGVSLVASADTWIESKAIQQLEKTAELEGILHAAGMPDLHPGRGYPVGAVFLSHQRIYPALVGNDIDSPLDESWADFIKQRQQELALTATVADRALGTIGGGNHFAELQQLDQVFQPELLAPTGIGTNAFAEYLAQHDHALLFAQLNRELIARRMLERLARAANTPTNASREC
jgi:release factor H-coupled RctB family protein